MSASGEEQKGREYRKTLFFSGAAAPGLAMPALKRGAETAAKKAGARETIGIGFTGDISNRTVFFHDGVIAEQVQAEPDLDNAGNERARHFLSAMPQPN